MLSTIKFLSVVQLMNKASTQMNLRIDMSKYTHRIHQYQSHCPVTLHRLCEEAKLQLQQALSSKRSKISKTHMSQNIFLSKLKRAYYRWLLQLAHTELYMKVQIIFCGMSRKHVGVYIPCSYWRNWKSQFVTNIGWPWQPLLAPKEDFLPRLCILLLK